MSKFWKETIPEGYYDISTQVGTKNGRSIQTNWHHITFTRVKVNIKKNDRILDFACGSGNFFASIDNLNEESIGLDISDKQIKYANKKYSDIAKFYTLENFDFESNKENFDVITCLGLIEFIEIREINELISKFYDLLKPGGTLIITTPNFQFTMKILEKILNKIGKINYEEQYKNRFVYSDLVTLFSNTQFSHFEIKKIITGLVFLSIISNKISSKLNELFENFLKNKLGFLFLVTLKK